MAAGDITGSVTEGMTRDEWLEWVTRSELEASLGPPVQIIGGDKGNVDRQIVGFLATQQVAADGMRQGRDFELFLVDAATGERIEESRDKIKGTDRPYVPGPHDKKQLVWAYQYNTPYIEPPRSIDAA